MNDFDQEENLKDMAAFIQSAGYVHQSELKELVERWRESHEWATENREICSNEAIRKAESMIEDLEELIE